MLFSHNTVTVSSLQSCDHHNLSSLFNFSAGITLTLTAVVLLLFCFVLCFLNFQIWNQRRSWKVNGSFIYGLYSFGVFFVTWQLQSLKILLFWSKICSHLFWSECSKPILDVLFLFNYILLSGIYANSRLMFFVQTNFYG